MGRIRTFRSSIGCRKVKASRAGASSFAGVRKLVSGFAGAARRRWRWDSRRGLWRLGVERVTRRGPEALQRQLFALNLYPVGLHAQVLVGPISVDVLVRGFRRMRGVYRAREQDDRDFAILSGAAVDQGCSRGKREGPSRNSLQNPHHIEPVNIIPPDPIPRRHWAAINRQLRVWGRRDGRAA